jgi:hypothetical protein
VPRVDASQLRAARLAAILLPYTMLGMIREAGPFGWMILVAAMPAAAMPLAALFARRPPLVIAGWLAAFAPLVLGLLGWVRGRAQVDSVLGGNGGGPSIDPARLAELRAMGELEAFQNVKLGVIASGPALILAVAATALWLHHRASGAPNSR